MPSCQRESKQKMDPEEDKDEGILLQNSKQEMKAVYGHSDFESSDNECHKALHVMFGGSWDITSQRSIKTPCHEVAATIPTIGWCYTASGWRCRSASTPLIVLRAWRELASSR
jgi:hypothetical protein